MRYEVRLTEEFEIWLDGVRDARAVKIIRQRIVRLEGGLFGDVKPIGDGVSELRIDTGAGYRLYFVTRGSSIVVLLCGGDKSSQRRDVKRAKEIAADLE